MNLPFDIPFETMTFEARCRAKSNPNCPTCKGNGIVDVDDFIVSMCPVYAECPGCIDPTVKTATGKPINVPWTPK